jgi:hypothetical protein
MTEIFGGEVICYLMRKKLPASNEILTFFVARGDEEPRGIGNFSTFCVKQVV